MRYNPALDGIRAIAALTVVAFHAKAPWLAGGFLGVDVFFVLSGYLITRLLRDEYWSTGRISVGQFVGRRMVRLYPAMIVLLLAYLVLAPHLFPRVGADQHLVDAMLSGLYVFNYARGGDQPIPVLAHTWSLAVEMQFYLVWPLVLAAILRLQRSLSICALASLFLIATAWRIFVAAGDPAPEWQVYYRTDTHSSGLILGGLIALMNIKLRAVWGIVGVALIGLACGLSEWKSTATIYIWFSLAEIGSALLVLAAPSFLGMPAVAWIGRMSYGLYLWHYPIMRWMRLNDWGWPETLVAGTALALAAAAASYYLVEVPVGRRWRRHTHGGAPLYG